VERAFQSGHPTAQSAFFNPRLRQQIMYIYHLHTMQQVPVARAPARPRAPLRGCWLHPGVLQATPSTLTSCRPACGVQVNTVTGFVRRIKRDLTSAGAPAPAHDPAGVLRALVAAQDWRTGAAFEAEGVAKAAALRAEGSPGAAGEIYGCLAACYAQMDQPARALALYEQERAAFEAAGDNAGVGRACRNLGACYHNMGHFAQALPLYERALASYQAVGDRAKVGDTCEALTISCHFMRQYDRALAWCEQARAAYEAVGDHEGLARVCYHRRDLGAIRLGAPLINT